MGDNYAGRRKEVRWCSEDGLTSVGCEVVSKISSVGQIEDLKDQGQG